MAGFQCATCGVYHDDLPMALGAKAPKDYYDIPSAERERRTFLSSDQCVIDDERFFLLGCLDLPLVDAEGCFRWLTWVSLEEEDFDRACELWHVEGRESEPPCTVRLQSALPYAESTMHLRATLHTQPVGDRPTLILVEADHRLYREQRDGITMARVEQLVESALHG